MAKTPSTMLPLGTQAPDFTLTNAVDGQPVSLSQFDECYGLLVMFICNHCPFVIHVQKELVALANRYQEKGFGVVAINSNSIESHPQDGPDNMAELAREGHWLFPFLFDETQEVAKAYRAACTPDFYVFDGNKKLVYRGRMDDSRPFTDIPVTGNELSAAIDAVMAGFEVSPEQEASLGCNIKWREGNTPNYYGN